MASKYFKAFNFFKSKVSPTITKVEPNVPKTKLEKGRSKLAIQTQKTKASGAKLKQTLFESKNKAFKGDDFTFSSTKAGKGKQPRNKKMGGGFMGKRMGYKGGSKPDFLDLDKDGNTSEPMKQAAKQAKRKK